MKMIARHEGRCFIIAEAGSVHDGSLGNAKKLVELTAACGADAIKFQTHIPEAETVKEAPPPPFFRDEPRYDYFARTGFTPQQWAALKQHCDDHGIQFLSSPFSIEAVELLEAAGLEAYKIPSGEVTNLPLLEAVARTGKPVLLSSGMSTWEELDRAVETLLSYHQELCVLQCTSQYPCAYENVGLNVMLEMADRYGVPVGLSDHTLTPFAALAAVTLGASVLEKHLTFSRRMYGSDARHSMEPEEFSAMVEGIRAIEEMLNAKVDKDDISAFRELKDTFEKSLVARVPIPQGAVIQEHMLAVKKPGTGLAPSLLPTLIGRRAARSLPADHLLSEEDLEA